MSSLPRVSYPGKQAWIGLLVSGLIFLAVAAAVALVVGTLAFMTSMFVHSTGKGQNVSLLRSWLTGISADAWFMILLCSVAFFASMIAARSRWIYRPALSAPLACAIFLLALLAPSIDDTLRSIAAGQANPLSVLIVPVALFPPLASAALGGRLGGRWFGKD